MLTQQCCPAACFEQLGANIKIAIQGITTIRHNVISHLTVNNNCVKEILSRAGGAQVWGRDLVPS